MFESCCIVNGVCEVVLNYNDIIYIYKITAFA